MKSFTYDNNDKMPLLGLGTWKSNDREAYHAVREAINIGYRHFDCAARYDNEKEIGEAFSDAIKAGDVSRQELWITSKLWNNAHLAQHVQPALETTLKDLQLDYLDLYLIHWPIALKPDVIFPAKGDEFLSENDAPIEKTWEQMINCYRKGLSKHIGVSNFNIPKIKNLISQGLKKPECNQVESHPFLQQEELLDYCKKNRIAFTAYSPLGSQDRPDRLKKHGEPPLLKHSVIDGIAAELGCSPGQVLIAWAIQRGSSVIPKSSNPGRLRDNFTAEKYHLDDEQISAIESLDRGFRFIDGAFWAIEGSPYTVEALWEK